MSKLPVLAALAAARGGAGTRTPKGASAGEGGVCPDPTPSRLHLRLQGLLGSAHALSIGALARACHRALRGAPPEEVPSGTRPGFRPQDPQAEPPVSPASAPPSQARPVRPGERFAHAIVLAIVESADAALDLVADLRAFRALEEALRPPPGPQATGAVQESVRARRTRLGDPRGAAAPPAGPLPAAWEDPDLPASASLPEELRLANPLETVLFPAWDVLPTESDRPEGTTLAGRQRATDLLRAYRQRRESWSPALKTEAPLPEACVLIAPVAAVLQPCAAPEDPGARIVLETGASWDPILLGRRLSDLGYERTGQVEVHGEYALRGGLLDVFPFASEHPYRVDFFDEEIESIRPFDPLSQRSEAPVAAFEIADSSLGRLRAIFAPDPQRSATSLLEHLPGEAVVVWVEPARLRQRAELFSASLVSGRSSCFTLQQLRERAARRLDQLDLLPLEEGDDAESIPGGLGKGAQPARGAPWGDDLEDSDRDSAPGGEGGGGQGGALTARSGGPSQPVAGLTRRGKRGKRGKGEGGAKEATGTVEGVEEAASGRVSAGTGDSTWEGMGGDLVRCGSLQRLQGEISERAPAWKRLAATRMALYVFCETEGDRRRLRTLLTEAGVLPAPTLQLVMGRLSGGFDLRAIGLAVVSDHELLGRGRHAPGVPLQRVRKATADARPVASIFELQPGDYVVHAAHGIGRYLGLERLEKRGRMEDYLALQYAEETKLYVPAAHISLVCKYIGGASTLELSRLGSKAWARKKERAQAAIQDLAEDLLRVQALRKSRPGIIYPPDGEWQQDFEAAFPYQETPDQLLAIQAVKKDMQGTCPMDRLLCGDVGFGKTEVAVRAAFKAVCAGKQFVVLVPTTLLCEQHARTFRERFAGFPITVEALSRFRSAREQKEILSRLATGRLDGVVGTHRVIQKDVRFKDLGLAIIDEEQRFGVQHKEFFKTLRSTVDVLTLTATPIPRTLHMAMLGIRDISNLTTPPQNRRSIGTKVARVSEDLLRRAILRELARGGQVFVIHPRVHDIEEFRDFLARLVPEARMIVGHGQMESDELEEVMEQFVRRERDVLISTTIVENGLDIPTANTILIHEADHFGLAELHQLRGRVGRSDIQAYCYLLLPESRPVTPEGLKRLRALEEFDELGAGFQLALRDLEIRGAGNVLGSQQSGWIAEIGYDLYCKLLDATARKLRGEETPDDELEVNIILRGPAFIPEAYVEDEKAVIEFYRRLESARDDEQLAALQAELKERFGPLPEPATRLLDEHKLRLLAQAASVPYVGIDAQEQRLVLKFHDWDMKALDRVLRGLPEAKGIRILDGETLSFGLSLQAKHREDALREMVRGLLQAFAQRREVHGSRAAATVPPRTPRG